jgi:hypothetical protein
MTLLDQLSSRFSVTGGLNRMSVGISNALSRLGISAVAAPSAAAEQDASQQARNYPMPGPKLGSKP